MNSRAASADVKLSDATRCAAAGAPQWLDDTEMAAWRGFIETTGALNAALDADLAAHGLTIGDYEVLVRLSESPDERLRMCDLATQLRLSPSGLTRRLDGLVASGLVVREPSASDRRVMLAALTPAGLDTLEAAAPDHLAGVRRQFIDRLDRSEIEHLASAFAKVQLGLRNEQNQQRCE